LFPLNLFAKLKSAFIKFPAIITSES